MSKIIKVVTIISLLLLPTLVYNVLVGRLRLTGLEPRPQVMLIGSFSDEESFARQVKQGMEHARFKPSDAAAFDLVTFDQSIPSANWEASFLQKLANGSTRIIISAQNSPEVPALLDLITPLGIPVVLTVATNHDLTTAPADYVLQFPPSNNDQANQIAAAIGRRGCASAGLIYETNNYGRGLATALRTQLHALNVVLFEFRINDDVEIMPHLHFLKEHGTRCLVFAGYYSRVNDLVTKLCGLDFSGQVLLSDGCFSRHLRSLPACGFDLSLAFPVQPFPEEPGDLTGFSLYGHDAAILIADSLTAAGAQAGQSLRLLPVLKQRVVLNNEIRDAANKLALRGEYSFDLDGHNTAAHFQVWPVQEAVE